MNDEKQFDCSQSKTLRATEVARSEAYIALLTVEQASES